MKSDIYCEKCNDQLDQGEPFVTVYTPEESTGPQFVMNANRFCVPCALIELAEAAAAMLREGDQ